MNYLFLKSHGNLHTYLPFSEYCKPAISNGTCTCTQTAHCTVWHGNRVRMRMELYFFFSNFLEYLIVVEACGSFNHKKELILFSYVFFMLSTLFQFTDIICKHYLFPHLYNQNYSNTNECSVFYAPLLLKNYLNWAVFRHHKKCLPSFYILL